MYKLFRYTPLKSLLTNSRGFCTSSAISSSTNPPKKIPTNVFNFEELTNPLHNFAYIDKTLFIKDVLLEKKNNNFLILRPLGWGKTLNLSMLKNFFSFENANNATFKTTLTKLKVGQEQNGELVENHAFKSPVIHLDLGFDYEENPSLIDIFNRFVTAISQSYNQHKYLIDSPHLSAEERHYVENIYYENISKIPDENSESIIRSSLFKLSELLFKHHGKQSVILIDNYDVPANISLMGGFYNEILKIMQEFFDQTLANNKNLYKAVVMGVMPITKSYLFSSLKTITSVTFINEKFEDHYGFNDDEIKGLLSHFPSEDIDLNEHIYINLKGYYSHSAKRRRFYNPASVLNYIQTRDPTSLWMVGQSRREFDLIYHLFMRSLPHDFQDIFGLMEKRFQLVERNVHWHIIDKYKSHPTKMGLYYNPVKIWSVLLYTGYITLADKPQKLATHYLCKLQIPNMEIISMLKYLKGRFSRERISMLNEMKKDLREKDIRKFFQKCTATLNKRLLWDDFPKWYFTKERHYHDFLEVVFHYMDLKDYEIISEEKSGEGRVDIMLIPGLESTLKHAYIFELKFTDNPNKISKMFGKALYQVQDRDYIKRILEHKHVDEVIIAGVVGTDKRVIYSSNPIIVKPNHGGGEVKIEGGSMEIDYV